MIAGIATEYALPVVWMNAGRARKRHRGIQRVIVQPLLLQTICIAAASTAAYSVYGSSAPASLHRVASLR